MQVQQRPELKYQMQATGRFFPSEELYKENKNLIRGDTDYNRKGYKLVEKIVAGRIEDIWEQREPLSFRSQKEGCPRNSASSF